MLTVRLSRGGAKKRPFFNVVVTDSRNSRDGRFVERVGYFNPIAKGGEKRLVIDNDKLAHWVNVGAKLSDRVSTLVKEAAMGGEQVAAKKEAKKAKTATKKAAALKAKQEAEAKEEPESSDS